jgi:uncharacterized protein YuzE
MTTAEATYWHWSGEAIHSTVEVIPGTLHVDIDTQGRIVGIECVGRSLTDQDAWTILHMATLA